MRYLALSIIALALIVSCSGRDKSAGPEPTPRISTSPEVVAFVSAAEAYALPDPISEVLTNNTEDTLQCYLTHASNWLFHDVDTLCLPPHTSQTVSLTVEVAGLSVGQHLDTLLMYNSDDSTRMRHVLILLTILDNNTYLTTSDPRRRWEYLGWEAGYRQYYGHCTWRMICNSNGGNPVHVFRYVAAIPGDSIWEDVDVDVLPNVPYEQEKIGEIAFILKSTDGPEINLLWWIRIGYQVLGQEKWLTIEYHL